MERIKFTSEILPRIIDTLNSLDIEVLSVDSEDDSYYVILDCNFIYKRVIEIIESIYERKFSIGALSKNNLCLIFDLTQY